MVTHIGAEQRTNPARVWTAEETQEWNRMHAEAEAKRIEADRLDQLRELQFSTSGAMADNRTAGQEDVAGQGESLLSSQSPEVRDKVKRLRSLEFRSWLINDPRILRPELREEHASLVADVGPVYNRALSAATGNLGGDTVPQGFVYQLDTALKYYGGIIDAADYIDTDQGNLLPWPSINDTANVGEVITENTQVAGSSGGASEQDPAYSVVNFNAWMFDTGFVLVPIQLLQDSAFNVEQYLDEQLQIRIGRKLNNLCTVGAGASSNQPNGVITAVGSSNTYTGGAANAVSYADTINLEYQVDLSYRRKASYMMHDTSVKSVRLLTDSNGRPLWIAGGVSEGIINKAPDTLNGYPVWVNNDVPTIGAGNKSMLFGDFSKYKIRRVKTTQLVRANERFIDKLQVGFLAFQRFDGNLVDAGTHPIAVLQHPAS
jgi:HK97 family phage major capsid protein